jgi:hypothetical protein
MHYKGSGRHTQEELETIIDELLEAKAVAREIVEQDKVMLDQLSEFVREIYRSVNGFVEAVEAEPKWPYNKMEHTFNPGALREYIQQFAKDNKFDL